MEEPVPYSEHEAAIAEKVMEMHQAYDEGLREFQEALSYCIFYMHVHSSKNSTRKSSIQAALVLRDLQERLKDLEELIAETH